MSDEIDLAQECAEIARVNSIRAASKPIPVGVPGDCDYCGEAHPRLVHCACPRCRDTYRLDIA